MKVGNAPPDRSSNAANLYASPGEALRKVAIEYEYCSGKLTETSLQMCYALIGANWAVFSSLNGVLQNSWAKWSLFMVIGALASNIVGAWFLSEFLKQRVAYGENDSSRWEREYQTARHSAGSWPFTDWIDFTGRLMRIIKATCTLIAGFLFIIGAVLK